MTLVVPAVLGGLAIAVMAFVSVSASRRQRQRSAEPEYLPTILVHSINDDRCTGCDACVAVCPTNVLDLVDNKSRVLRFQDCIQCEACMWACPTEALVMHKEGAEPPLLTVPELDDYYQTAIPGQYLIGEVAGKPLVKNAANLGRAVVEHMLSTGIQPGATQVDVVIVGSGPGGLSAALTCIQRGLSYVLLEKEKIIASTVARYPKGKLVMAEPYDTRNLSLLPVFDSSKEELVPLWQELIDRVGVRINLGEAVEEVVPEGPIFRVRTTVAQYQAQRVVLATGTRGKPRTLGVPGENLNKVSSLLEDPDVHRGQAVLVVGGGDSALEATIALADAGAKVILSYRGRTFSRAQPKLKSTVEKYEAQRRIKIKYQSVITEFGDDTVTLQMADGSLKKYPNQAAFVLIGSEPPVKWLRKVGVDFVERPHAYALPKSDDLVGRLVPSALDCPETADAAAAQVQGREVAPENRPLDARNERGSKTGGRKWLRSASSIFGRSKKLERPMSLGEFARRHHTHSGSGRRDQLDPSERTRVLRMLRDEGARLADEESSVELFEAPAGRADWADDAAFPDSPVPSRAPSPPQLEETAPKQAVIVGLAQAAARREKRKTGQPRPEHDHHGNVARPAEPVSPRQAPRRVDTGELLNGLIEQDRARKRRASGSPPPAAPSHPFDEPTAITGVPQPTQTTLPPDEPTEMVDFEQMVVSGRPPVPQPRPRVVSDSVRLSVPGGSADPSQDSDVMSSDHEATRAVDVERLADLERSRVEQTARRPDSVHDDPTRQIDLNNDRLRSLSDIEFDLD